jgi:hypothetical protein
MISRRACIAAALASSAAMPAKLWDVSTHLTIDIVERMQHD